VIYFVLNRAMNKHLYLLFCIALVIGFPLQSRSQVITTFAGNGSFGYSGDGFAATNARLDSSTSLAMDGAGNVYISDQFNNVIRKVSTTGIITTIAGSGIHGFGGDNGPATAAMLSQNWGIASDYYGNIYVADQNNIRVRKISTSGIITTIAGNGLPGDTGDGGPATDAKIGPPLGIAADHSGNVYFGDPNNHCIHKIDGSGIITTFAGNRTYGFSGDGGPATTAQLTYFYGLAVDRLNNLYICDGENNRVRKVNTGGVITTVAGNGVAGFGADNVPATGTSLNLPTGIYVTAAGNIFVADCFNHRIRKIDEAGFITTVAGTGTMGYNGDGIPATNARLNRPSAVLVDTLDNIYLSDLENGRVRKVNNVLSFTGGDFQGLNVCENTTPIAINSLLAVLDIYTGINDTWTLQTPPVHGTAIVGYSATSTGGVLTPTGLTYTPASGYTGHDSFKVRVASTLFSDIITIYVSIDPFVSAGTITGPTSLCVGASILLSNTTPGGVWTSNELATVTPLTLSANIMGVAPGLDTINYTISNSCGTVFTSKIVTINPLPDAGLVWGPGEVCKGSAIAMLPTVAGGTWSASSIIVTVNATGVVYGISPGSATVIYTVSNSFCTATVLHPVTVEVSPDPGTILGPLKLCVGAQITLTNAIAGGTWSGDVLVSIAPTGVVSGISAGVGNITYAVTNSCGTVITVRPITVYAPPDPPVISEDQGLLSVPSTFASYQWFENGTLIQGAVYDTTSALKTGAYYVEVTNVAGCSSASQTLEHVDCGINEIELFPNPTASVLYIQWCKKVMVRVMAMDGREIAVVKQANKIDMSGLPNADYMITVFDGSGKKIMSRRITKLTQ
jgi:hypothetical protein